MDETTPLVTKQYKQHWLRIKPSPWVLYPVLLFLGTIISTLQGPLVQFIIDLMCDRIDSSTEVIKRPREQCNADSEVQAQASNLLMWSTVVSSVIGLLTTSIYSKMSDKKGRRPVMIINGMGFIGDMIVSCFIIRFKDTANPWLMLLSATLLGLGGGVSTLLMCLHAYCADCTLPAERTVAFGRIVACFICGTMLGPSLAGWIMGPSGSIEPIALMALAALVLWVLFVIFILPESNVKSQEESLEVEAHNEESIWSKINFLSTLSILFKARPELTNNAALPILALIQFLCRLAGVGFISTVVLYVTYVFAWSPTDVGFFLSFEGGAQLVGLVVVIPVIKKLHEVVVPEGDHSISTRHSSIVLDLMICRFGVLFYTISMLIFALANVGWMMYLGAIFQIGGSMYLASTKSLMVQIAGEDNAGLILGAAAIVDSITMTTAPLVANTLYSHFVSTMPWIVFMAGCAALAMATIISLFIRVRPLHAVSP